MLIEARLVVCLPSSKKNCWPNVFAYQEISFGFSFRRVRASAEDMVLVDAFGELTAPDPAPAKLVSVTAFVEQDVAGPQREVLNLVFGRNDFLHFGQIEIAPLDIRHS